MDAFIASALSNTTISQKNLDNNVLNELLAILVDSKNFFEQAEKLVEHEGINTIFVEYAAERGVFKEKIKNLLVSRGAVPIDSGTISGELRKLYTECLALLDDDPLRLLEQIKHHELRNLDLLDDLKERAQTLFVTSIIAQSRDEIFKASERMNQYLTKHQQTEDH